MAILAKDYFKYRDYIINFYQIKNCKPIVDKPETCFHEDQPFITSNLRNLVIVFHDLLMTIQYFEDEISHIVYIDFENKKIGRNSTLFSDEELRLFDALDFELFDSYAKTTNTCITDWLNSKKP